MNKVTDAGLTYQSIDPAVYETRGAYQLLISALVPRPIAWTVTINEDGTYNCAPFSFFMGVSSKPPMIAFAVGERRTGVKDTARNIRQRPDFTVNIVNERLAEQMVQTSGDYGYGVNEFEKAGLTRMKSDMVAAPRIQGAPVQMECRVSRLVEIPEARTLLIVGNVLRFHVDAEVMDPSTGLVDIRKLKPVGRLGGKQYCRVHDIFEMDRPAV
jgi:flavin reductase (DIM6/NTAB) family NADH-FMN oxidoreductase RutF